METANTTVTTTTPRFATTNNKSGNALPLNLLVDAAIGTVSSSGRPIVNNNNNYLTMASLKRGLMEQQQQQSQVNRNHINGIKMSSFPHKKRRVVMTESTTTTSQEDTNNSTKTNNDAVLMQRLSAMGGGFPMPKWGSFNSSSSSSSGSVLSKGGHDQQNTFKKKKSTEALTKQAIQVSQGLDTLSSRNNVKGFFMPRIKEEDTLRLLTKKPILTSFEQVWTSQKWNGNLELQKEALTRKLLSSSPCKKIP